MRYAAESLALVLSIASAAIAVRGAAPEDSVPLRSSSDAVRPARLPARAVPESHALDVVTQGPYSTLIGTGATPISVSRGLPVAIVGWAVDRRAARPSRAVYVVLDGTAIATTTGEQRDDVAAALGNTTYGASGFRLQLAARTLPTGTVTLHVRGVSADGTATYALEPPITLDVRP